VANEESEMRFRILSQEDESSSAAKDARERYIEHLSKVESGDHGDLLRFFGGEHLHDAEILSLEVILGDRIVELVLRPFSDDVLKLRFLRVVVLRLEWEDTSGCLWRYWDESEFGNDEPPLLHVSRSEIGTLSSEIRSANEAFGDGFTSLIVETEEGQWCELVFRELLVLVRDAAGGWIQAVGRADANLPAG
jgi:hypothetical protein